MKCIYFSHLLVAVCLPFTAAVVPAHMNGLFTLDKFFIGYMSVPVIIVVSQMTLMTPDGYKTAPQLEEKNVGRGLVPVYVKP